ncbi:hypothetical protein [Aquirufa aurantiipilula]|uniref:hypothetical protein n=1 Tax=Aquirufa aurantiipilula TaxID=2696561 RepID=UPI001CAA46D4|nr:hypothetical protein [Aquirufa aurantiipilula]MBZ1327732.1 hypothetical protein [Aquirufa aurantiipilula]
MKNLFLALFLLGSTLSVAKTNKVSRIEITTNKKNIECRFGQCQATAKSTVKQCKHCVSNSGDKFYYQHK